MGNPTVTPIVEQFHIGGHIVWQPCNGMITRDVITLIAGSGVCLPSLVLGSELSGGVAAATALGTNTGNGAMGAITVGPAALVGDYKLLFVEPAANAGAFIVEDPLGNEVGHGNVAAAFSAGGLSFTLADGATDFVAGDSFTITVTGALKYGPYDPTATNGLQNAAGILFTGKDATSADKRSNADVRGPMSVNGSELVWGANVTTTQHKNTAIAQLGKLGIRVV